MFVRIVHHWCRPGMVQAGREFSDRVGALTSAAPGFMYRYRLETVEDPLLLTTFSVWRDRMSFDEFQSGRKPADHSDPSYPFDRMSHQAFDVTATLEGAASG